MDWWGKTEPKYQCEVLSIQEREENLESYYVNLIGGASHE